MSKVRIPNPAKILQMEIAINADNESTKHFWQIQIWGTEYIHCICRLCDIEVKISRWRVPRTVRPEIEPCSVPTLEYDNERSMGIGHWNLKRK